jgi:NADH:ubiquinone oxidoreductase subunit
VGHYLGRNLQVKDLEIIEDEIERVRRQAMDEMYWSPSGKDSDGRVRVRSVLQRDVIVMTAVWKEWVGRIAYEVQEDGARVAVFGILARPRLRFARVREEVLASLTTGDMYFGDE